VEEVAGEDGGHIGGDGRCRFGKIDILGLEAGGDAVGHERCVSTVSARRSSARTALCHNSTAAGGFPKQAKAFRTWLVT
jgi:hypothetical protein